MVRWVWKEKIKTHLLLHSPARCVPCRLPYICEAWAWVNASTVVKLFNKRDNHLFLHSTVSLHRSNWQKTWSSQAFCPTKHHLNSHPSLPNCCTTVSTAHKYMKLEICLINNSLKNYFHPKFLCIDADPDYHLNPKVNNTCTYTYNNFK